MKVITTRDMLAIMESGDSFHIVWTTFDKRREGKSGKILESEAVLHRKEEDETTGGRALTEVEQLQLASTTRNPNHGKHFTRNIRLLTNGHPTADIRKIHPRLVNRFNGFWVVP